MEKTVKLRGEKVIGMGLTREIGRFSLSRKLNLPNRGSIRTFKITVSTNRETRKDERFLLFSSGKIGTIIRALFGKWLWDELTEEEMTLFHALPGVLADPCIFACLRARALGIPKSKIRERLETVPFSVSFPSHRQYVSLIGGLFLLVVRQEVNRSKSQPYSGWARHHNDKGSLRSSMVETFTPPEILEPTVSNEKLILDFLTTGEIEFFAGRTLYNPI